MSGRRSGLQALQIDARHHLMQLECSCSFRCFMMFITVKHLNHVCNWPIKLKPFTTSPLTFLYKIGLFSFSAREQCISQIAQLTAVQFLRSRLKHRNECYTSPWRDSWLDRCFHCRQCSGCTLHVVGQERSLRPGTWEQWLAGRQGARVTPRRHFDNMTCFL